MKGKGVTFARFAVRRFDDECVPQVAASMMFMTFLILAPVLAVMVVIASASPIFDQWSGEFVSFISRTIVPQGTGIVFDCINAFRDKTTKLTAIGSVMLVVTLLILTRTIDNVFNRIWRVNSQRPWMMQLLVYWTLLMFGSLSLGVGLSVVIGQVQLVDDSEWLRIITAVLFTTMLLWGLYRFMPNRSVPASHASIDAAVTAFCLETAHFLFAWYMGNFDGYKSVYGTSAVVSSFLLWLNLLWTLVLGGAVLTPSLSYWRGGMFRRSLNARGRFDDVLKILLLLDFAQQNGEALPVQESRRRIDMGFDESDGLLEKLARHGYVYSGHQGWILKTGAESIDLVELSKLFVYRLQTLDKDKVNQTVDHTIQPCSETLNMTLTEFGVCTEKQPP